MSEKEPVSTCGACGQTDDHPKHQILVGFNNADTDGQMFHPHDENRDGVVEYHFDCPTPYHDLAAVLGRHEDPDAQAEIDRVVDEHNKVIAACRGGLKGTKLRTAIVNGDI